MAKAPAAGRAKTRLAREVGTVEAVRFARHATLALLHRVAADPRWATLLAVAPDAAADSRFWPLNIARQAQGRGNLGCRMQRIIDRMPPGPVVIIGTDIPDIARFHIATAFRLLGTNDAVFGPADDGGYWLVGFKRRPHVLRPFQDVRWSTANALSDTLKRLAGRSVAFLPKLTDVDDAQDLSGCAARFGRRIVPLR